MKRNGGEGPGESFDREMSQYVADANGLLMAMQEMGCRWWSYSVSHRTLELVIGDPLSRGGNLVLCLTCCKTIGGPVDWLNQRLHVTRNDDREDGREYTIADESVGFEAIGGVFLWCRDYKLCKFGSAYAPHVE